MKPVKLTLLLISIMVLALSGCKKESRASNSVLPIEDTNWELVSLYNQPVNVSEGMTTPTIIFVSEKHQINGSGGCNHYFGNYSLKDQKLEIGPIGSTRKICSKNDRLENQFFRALEAADKFISNHETLTLLQNEKPIALFKQKK